MAHHLHLKRGRDVSVGTLSCLLMASRMLPWLYSRSCLDFSITLISCFVFSELHDSDSNAYTLFYFNKQNRTFIINKKVMHYCVIHLEY
jgi:hypothetical protein